MKRDLVSIHEPNDRAACHNIDAHMMSFRGDRLSSFSLPTAVVWFIDEIAEAKGRQALYTRQAPQVLKALREMALVQSTESSNRIEGVTVDPDRLRPLVIGQAKPRDRSEREIFGYRHALGLIHANAAGLSIEPGSRSVALAQLFPERRAARLSGVREPGRRRAKSSGRQARAG